MRVRAKDGVIESEIGTLAVGRRGVLLSAEWMVGRGAPPDFDPADEAASAFVDVEAGDVLARLGEACARDQANVAGANHRQLHQRILRIRAGARGRTLYQVARLRADSNASSRHLRSASAPDRWPA